MNKTATLEFRAEAGIGGGSAAATATALAPAKTAAATVLQLPVTKAPLLLAASTSDNTVITERQGGRRGMDVRNIHTANGTRYMQREIGNGLTFFMGG